MDGDLYMAFGDAPAPGLLMLAPDRTAWLDLPLHLQAQGFTVMTMDLRPNATVGDVDAMLRALTQMEVVDAGHMGLIGAEAGADLALVACAQGTPCGWSTPAQGTTVTGAI
jgi:dienelactone hydrolase